MLFPYHAVSVYMALIGSLMVAPRLSASWVVDFDIALMDKMTHILLNAVLW